MKFLEQIADYYTSSNIRDLADYTFIFPNKRSAMFLKKYIQQRVGDKAVFMPRFTTFGRFAAKITRVSEASHFERLFMLYDSYCRTVEALNTAGGDENTFVPKEFDKFIFWGDMILDDFDEIDRALADPVKLYSNLEALHDIAADYLSDEQKDIISRIWGHTRFTEHIESFWLHAKPDGRDMVINNRFLSLWRMLPEIYRRFSDRLAKERLTTPGRQMRDAALRLSDTAIADIKRRHYVFVGLSDVTNAELCIMARMRRAEAADFFWDLSSPFFYTPDGKINEDNPAIRIISRLAKEFPMPDDFEMEQIGTPARIDIIGVPSAVVQAKAAGAELERMASEGMLDGDGLFNTAVIVPEAGQLTSLMLALPHDIPAVNVTMGLPYTSTTFATLFRSIISMQRRSRKRRGGVSYFFQDVLEILLHPHLQLLAGGKAEAMRQKIFNLRLFNLEADYLLEEFPELDYIFRPILNQESLEESCEYVVGLVNGVRAALEANAGMALFNTSFELDILRYFDAQIAVLRQLIDKYAVTMRESTFLMLFERILQSKTINVEGTPLKGLQVMGVLETRAIDFDNIMFLSMNERTFPRHDYVRTMIPNSLRRGYGLPPIEQSESFYAYYFFRAISRASRVTLFYDSRSSANGAGEMSRYLAQLLYLHGNPAIVHRQMQLEGKTPAPRTIEVKKEGKVLEQLESYRRPGGLRISASALKTYLGCPLSFYLRFVNDLREDDDPVDYLDPAKIGDIFHHTAQRLFDKYKGGEITSDTYREMDSDGRLESILIDEIAHFLGMKIENPTMSDLNCEGQLIKGQVEYQLRAMLAAEEEKFCSGGRSFVYVGGEQEYSSPQWQVCDGLAINFKMLVDRIDRLPDGSLRFVDYKTGGDDYKIGSTLDNLFKYDSKKMALLQLMVYSEAYADMVDPTARIRPTLHRVKEIVRTGQISDLCYSDTKPLPDFPGFSADFRPRLNELMSEIFDPAVPFTQCEDPAHCKWCQFMPMCGRTAPAGY